MGFNLSSLAFAARYVTERRDDLKGGSCGATPADPSAGENCPEARGPDKIRKSVKIAVHLYLSHLGVFSYGLPEVAKSHP